MNYAYLFVDNLNGHSYENGSNELRSSINILKEYKNSNDLIYVFNNEIKGKNINFFKIESINHQHIELSRNYNKSDKINPISILVEKIISLMNFKEDEDVVLMDIDTSFMQKIPLDYWDSNYAVFDNVEYPIMQWRNLDKVLPQIPWKSFDIKFDSSFMMYNTGVIYIPKKFRRELCEKALKIVDYLNDNFDPEQRCGNKLDEQIALSIVVHDCYGKYNHIKFSNNYIHHHWAEKQDGIKWWDFEKFKHSNIDSNKIEGSKLPLSIGILSWNSNQTLRNTLESYKRNGLFDIVNDITLFFQEVTEEDIEIANEYNLPYIFSDINVGIGNAFVELAKNCKTDNVLLLEHDWELIENKEITLERLKSGINFLNSGFNCIKYRHRKNPGFPLYGLYYRGKELGSYQDVIKLESPCLFDCIHWIQEPHLEFSDYISKKDNFFVTTSRWSNFTNNPCMYKKEFYLQAITPFKDRGSNDYDRMNHLHNLEDHISYWWARQNFKVSAGRGLFSHNDIQKHGITYFEPQISDENFEKQNSISFICAHRTTDIWSTPLSLVNEFKKLGWKTEIYSLFDENDNYVDNNILELLKTIPDIIIHMDFGQHTSSILGELRKTGSYCIMESGDDPQRFDSNKIKSPWFDLILSPDIRCVEKYKEIGYNAEWWTHFTDTDVYYPLNIEPTYIAVCSRGVGNDAFIIDSLSQKYPDKIKNQNGWFGSDHNKFLNSGEIVLQQSRYGEITRRIFEGMSCKKLVLADRLDSSTKIQELFVDGEDIIFYDNEMDCLNKIVYYSNNQEEARRIAENGYNKVLENHTQKQRVEFIINKWKSIVK